MSKPSKGYSKNADTRARAGKGWHFQDTSDSASGLTIEISTAYLLHNMKPGFTTSNLNQNFNENSGNILVPTSEEVQASQSVEKVIAL